MERERERGIYTYHVYMCFSLSLYNYIHIYIYIYIYTHIAIRCLPDMPWDDAMWHDRSLDCTMIPVSVKKKHSFCASPCPAVRWQKLPSSP